MKNMYPPAEWLGNGNSGGSYTGGPWKVVLHTTETKGLPPYKDSAGIPGNTAPHLTFDPISLKWYQHTSLFTAARSLRNGDDPVQTNRDQAIQVEIICYSSKTWADAVGGLWVGDLSPEALASIRVFLEWTFAEFGVKDYWPGRQAYSYSEANAPGFRMFIPEWDSFNGVCAHQHVPDGNDHWDTGALDWSAIIGRKEETMYPINVGDGTKNQRPEKAEDIMFIQEGMNILGVKPEVQVDGTANQTMVDKFFELVGSPPGGSFISGAEGARFTALLATGGTVDTVARKRASRANQRLDALNEFDI